MPQNSHDMGVSLSSRSFCRLRSTFCLANSLRHSLLLFQSPSCLRHGIMKEDWTSLGVSFRFSINIPLIFLVSFSGLEITGHVCSPSEKPFCFSCLSVCIVVQGKGHFRHVAMPSFFLLTCVRLSTPYSIRKGHFAFVHLKDPRQSAYRMGPWRFHCVMLPFFHFLPSDRRAACWSFPGGTLVILYTAKPSIPQGSVATSWTGDLSHRYGSNSFAFLHFVESILHQSH